MPPPLTYVAVYIHIFLLVYRVRDDHFLIPILRMPRGRMLRSELRLLLAQNLGEGGGGGGGGGGAGSGAHQWGEIGVVNGGKSGVGHMGNVGDVTYGRWTCLLRLLDHVIAHVGIERVLLLHLTTRHALTSLFHAVRLLELLILVLQL